LLLIETGWHGVVKRGATCTIGFPKLHTLHIGCAMLHLSSGLLRTAAGSSDINDKTLLQLAGKSCLLKELDISGSHVTASGSMALAESLANCSAEKTLSNMSGRPSTTQATTDGYSPALEEAHGSGRGLLVATGAAVQTAVDGSGRSHEHMAAIVQPSAMSSDHPLKLQRSYISHCGGLARDDGLVLIGQLCGPYLQDLVVRNAGGRLPPAQALSTARVWWGFLTAATAVPSSKPACIVQVQHTHSMLLCIFGADTAGEPC